MVDQVGGKHRENVDWQVSAFASRDQSFSPSFRRICLLGFARERLLADQSIRQIVVESKGMQVALVSFLKEQGRKCTVTFAGASRGGIKNLLRPYYFGWRLLYLWITFRREGHKPQRADGPITLIDIFVLVASFSSDNFLDRYYCQKISDYETEARVVYFPTLFGFKGLRSCRQRMRASGRRFLFRESFLRGKDYLWALTTGWRLRKIAKEIPRVNFDGWDITALIQEDLRDRADDYSAISGILNYAFIQRLQEAGVELRLWIDWFENQMIDRGLNMAIRRFYGSTLSVGYGGYALPEFFLNITPSRGDFEGRVIPEEVAVIGAGWKEMMGRYAPDLLVRVAPAFRFSHVFAEHPPLDVISSGFAVLVALPMDSRECQNILGMIRLAFARGGFWEDARLIFKPHPTVPRAVAQNLVGENWPIPYEISFDSFGEAVGKAAMMISGSSSTCLEAMARGVFVAVVGADQGMTQLTVPRGCAKTLWALCYNAEELAQAMDRAQRLDREEAAEVAQEIKAAYFCEITDARIREFLRL
jgi:hypothetical protein